MTDDILTETHDAQGGLWVEITLNRPDKRNALTSTMHEALRHALDQADRAGARAVLLTGAGKGFCAGQDLADPAAAMGPDGQMDLAQVLTRHYNPLIQAIKAFEAPVICAVNGVAAGAGANIALACDVVLAADSAKFIQSFAALGLVPDAGGSWTLTQLLGEARAKALALTGEALPAARAAEWGLIWKALPDDALMGEARALAAKFAIGPTVGYAKTKQIMAAAATNGLDAQLRLEAEAQAACGRTPDFTEGVTAFLEKRAPVFTGRKP